MFFHQKIARDRVSFSFKFANERVWFRRACWHNRIQKLGKCPPPPLPGNYPYKFRSTIIWRLKTSLTCSQIMSSWLPTATSVIPGRSMSVKSGTSGDVISSVMAEELMLLFCISNFWAVNVHEITFQITFHWSINGRVLRQQTTSETIKTCWAYYSTSLDKLAC